MTVYLDTNVAVWLAQGALVKIPANAYARMRRADLRISPIVLLELEYLYEIGRLLLPAHDLRSKLEHEAGVHVCGLDFPAIINMALQEKWTRDPFDRIIVAQAKVNGLSHLITADEAIRKNFTRAVWDL